MPKNTTQCLQPVLEPRPLNPEMSALTMRPPRLPQKDLSNRPIYAVLNTYNLDMILQLRYMLIVMNPARIAVTGNPRNAMVCDAPSLQNEFGDP